MDTTSSLPPLTKRQKKILHAIIQEHLETAQPVGSKMLHEHFDLNVSPATIRNEMALLSEQGLIEQLHTSAGRIPTERGYKLYINNILDFSANIPGEKIKFMQNLLSRNFHSIRDMLSSLLSFLSGVSGQLALIAEPDYSCGLLKHLDIFRTKGTNLIVVISLEAGLDKAHIIPDNYAISDTQLSALVRYFNSRYAGMPINYIIGQISKDYFKENLETHSLLREIFLEIKDAISAASKFQLRTEGITGFLSQPEFKSNEQILQLLEHINDPHYFLNILHKYRDEDYTILMGNEIGKDGFDDFVLIFSRYELLGLPGYLGILGTKRMNYQDIIPLVGFACRMITELTTKGTIMPFVHKEFYNGR